MTDSHHNESRTALPSTSGLRLLSLLVRAALPVGVLVAGCFAYLFLALKPEKAKSPPAQDQVIRTNVAELRIRDYPVVIKTNGVVQAHNEVALNAQVSGQITNVSPAFEVGSFFSAGDVLVELDSRDRKTAVAVAQARYLGAWSALKLATVNLERNVALFRRNYGSEASVNQAAATHEQASAELDAATAELEQAKRDLERTKILAPFDGRVRQKSIGLGQSVNTGTTLGVVFAIDFAEVRLPIAARELPYLDLPELPDDAPVEVELRDAISTASETVWKANIVRTEGALDKDSLELFAIARVDDPFGRKSGHPPLRIGQPVVGSIAGKELDNVIALPRGAVRQLDQVFLVDKTELTLIARTIVPIWSDADHVIVRDPLIEDGAWLSTTRLVYAPNGAKVEIIPDLELTKAEAKSNIAENSEPVAN
jgi:RND family efflux transporter MFP subunit